MSESAMGDDSHHRQRGNRAKESLRLSQLTATRLGRTSAVSATPGKAGSRYALVSAVRAGDRPTRYPSRRATTDSPARSRSPTSTVTSSAS